MHQRVSTVPTRNPPRRESRSADHPTPSPGVREDSHAGAEPESRLPPSGLARIVGDSGEALPHAPRSRFESQFGVSLGDVRIHRDPASANLVGSADAAAVTFGNHVAFGPGRFDPESSPGRALLAHELAHVAQQRGATSHAVALDRSRVETEAAHAALTMMGSPQSAPSFTPTGLAVAMAPAESSSSPAEPAEQWLMQSPDTSHREPTELVEEGNKIQEYLDTQIASTPEVLQLEQARDEFYEAASSKVREAMKQNPHSGHPGRRVAKAKVKQSTPGPAAAADERPRVLRERTSVGAADPEVARRDFDEIVAYLKRDDVPRADRKLLQRELEDLAPVVMSRLDAESEHRRFRVASAAIEREAGGDMRKLAGILDRIRPDPQHPDAPAMHTIHFGDRVYELSNEQVKQLRSNFQDNVLLPLANRLEDSQRLEEEGVELVDDFRKRSLRLRHRGVGSQAMMLDTLIEASGHMEDREAFDARQGGFGSLLWYHGGRVVHGAVNTAKGMVTEPIKQLHDLALIGGYLLGADVDEHDMISGVAEGVRHKESWAKLLLASNPVSGIGVQTYDMTRAGIEGRWGDFSEQMGGFGAGLVIGKAMEVASAPRGGAPSGAGALLSEGEASTTPSTLAHASESATPLASESGSPTSAPPIPAPEAGVAPSAAAPTIPGRMTPQGFGEILGDATKPGTSSAPLRFLPGGKLTAPEPVPVAEPAAEPQVPETIRARVPLVRDGSGNVYSATIVDEPVGPSNDNAPRASAEPPGGASGSRPSIGVIRRSAESGVSRSRGGTRTPVELVESEGPADPREAMWEDLREDIEPANVNDRVRSGDLSEFEEGSRTFTADESAGDPVPIDKRVSDIEGSHQMGIEGGQIEAARQGIVLDDWNNPRGHIHKYGRGLDAIGSRGDRRSIIEYKGGESRPKGIQGTGRWVGEKLAELWWEGDRETVDGLVAAAREGKLEGWVIETRNVAGELVSTVKDGWPRTYDFAEIMDGFHDRLSKILR